MATNFPNGVDNFTNPTSGDTLDSPDHASQHADVNDAVEALQAKVGVDGSAVTSSLDYKVAHQGLVLISSATFANPNVSVSFDNVFSAAFENYRVVWNVDNADGGAELYLFFRSGGVDNTTTNYSYFFTGEFVSGTSVGKFYQNSGAGKNFISIGFAGSSNRPAGGVIDIFGPWKNNGTHVSFASRDIYGSGINEWETETGSGIFRLTNSFDGFKLLNAWGGFFAGRVTVYGYNF